MNSIIFPGQGAQYIGMGKSLYDNYAKAKDIFSTIDGILGINLSEKCFTGQGSELKDTAIQQLAILAVSVASFELFKDKKVGIDYLSGLSLGEYSCLHASEVLSLKDLVILVRERGLAMRKAALNNPSTMFAVMNIEKDILKDMAQKEGFYISNLNSSKQIVVSLSIDDKDKIKNVLSAEKARVIELEVSGGFHSPFMSEAKEALSKVMEGMVFNDAKIPIVSNFTGKAHTKNEEIKFNLLEQLVSPVLWKDCVEFMIGKGVNCFYEVGPSKVLKGLMRKINRDVKVINIETKEDIELLAD